MTFPKGTASAIEDLKAGLPLADLRQAGWAVTGPDVLPGGSTVVSASHPFQRLSQLPDLVADIAGNGPPGERPFRLSVSERHGFLDDHFAVSGTVDLSCSLSCFDDPHLQQDVGYPLGLPPSQLAQLLGPDPSRELTFAFQVALPGAIGRADTPTRTGNLLEWRPSLGRKLALQATSRVVNTATVWLLTAAIAAGTVLALSTAVVALRRRHRGAGRPKARPGGGQGGPGGPGGPGGSGRPSGLRSGHRAPANLRPR